MQADVERFLARLLTDREFRERFLAAPADVARNEGLSPEEAEAVARMPARGLRTAGRSYQHKRASSARDGGRRWWANWLRVISSGLNSAIARSRPDRLVDSAGLNGYRNHSPDYLELHAGNAWTQPVRPGSAGRNALAGPIPPE